MYRISQLPNWFLELEFLNTRPIYTLRGPITSLKSEKSPKYFFMTLSEVVATKYRVKTRELEIGMVTR